MMLPTLRKEHIMGRVGSHDTVAPCCATRYTRGDSLSKMQRSTYATR